MKKRDQKDIWNGLYDFMLIEKTRPVAIEKLLEDEMFMNNSGLKFKITGMYRHILTHQIIMARFITIKHSKGLTINGKNLKFFSRTRVNDLPKPILISQFLDKEQLL
jgi:A/G-specific adenine glycosylase